MCFLLPLPSFFFFSFFFSESNLLIFSLYSFLPSFLSFLTTSSCFSAFCLLLLLLLLATVIAATFSRCVFSFPSCVWPLPPSSTTHPPTHLPVPPPSAGTREGLLQKNLSGVLPVRDLRLEPSLLYSLPLLALSPNLLLLWLLLSLACLLTRLRCG